MRDTDFATENYCDHLLFLNRHGDAACRATPSSFQKMAEDHAKASRSQVMQSLPITCSVADVAWPEREAATLAAMQAGEVLIAGGLLTAQGITCQPALLQRQGDGQYQAGVVVTGAQFSSANSAANRFTLAVAEAALVAAGFCLPRHEGFCVYRSGQIDRITLAPADFAFLEPDNPIRTRIQSILDGKATTYPALGANCQQCVWKSHCKSTVQSRDDLSLIAELGRNKRDALMPLIPSVRALADIDVEQFRRDKKRTIFPGIGPASLAKFKERAIALTTQSGPYLKKPLDLPNLPRTIYFDLETDPFSDNFVYLHGFVDCNGRDAPSVKPVLTPKVSAAAERDAFAQAWAFMADAISAEDALLIHYAPFEKTTYLELARRYPEVVGVETIDGFFEHPNVVDLYTDWVRPHSVWPCNDMSIKTLAKFVGFSWRDSDPSGANSIVWFHDWVQNNNAAALQRVLDYNTDDNFAVAAVLRAMRTMPVRI